MYGKIKVEYYMQEIRNAVYIAMTRLNKTVKMLVKHKTYDCGRERRFCVVFTELKTFLLDSIYFVTAHKKTNVIRDITLAFQEKAFLYQYIHSRMRYNTMHYSTDERGEAVY